MENKSPVRKPILGRGNSSDAFKSQFIAGLVQRYEKTADEMSKDIYEQLEKEAAEEGTEEARRKEKEYFEQKDEDEEEMNLLFDEIIQGDKAATKSNVEREGSMVYKNAVKKNPLLKYGVGIQNYINMQTSLLKIFAVISLLAITQMLIYKSVGGLDYLTELSDYSRYSFGNMGFSGNSCGKMPVLWHNDKTKLHFQCQGTTTIKKVLSSGMLQSELSGGTDNVANLCYMDYSEEVDMSKHPEMINYQKDKVDAEVMAQCAGQQECTAYIPHEFFIIPEADQNYDQYLFAQVSCEQE
jgi:hypothetical protein